MLTQNSQQQKVNKSSIRICQDKGILFPCVLNTLIGKATLHGQTALSI